MTQQTKMPEPVAWMYETVAVDNNSHWSGPLTIVGIYGEIKPDNATATLLITTTQAEAYKDACVREALEQAAKQCEGRYQPWGNLADDRAADCMSRAAGRIRALIPPQQ